MPNDSLLSHSLKTGLVAVLISTGCSSGPGEQVDLNQFSNPIDTSAGASAPQVVYAPIAQNKNEPETLVIRPLETTGHVGSPEQVHTDQTSSNAAVYDAKIGDINGKPIIASTFLVDLMPRLRAEAETLGSGDRLEWRRAARPIIERKLTGMIRDEVLYREARARLPESSQQGLFHFVDRIRENLVRQAGGSETLAAQSVLEEENQTMDEFLASIEKQFIIKEILDIAAEDYAPVSWLDIQNEYQRQYKYFNPDPIVYFRIINATSDEAAATIQSRLESGDEFEAVAGDQALNSFAPDREGLFNEDGTAIDVPLEEATLIADPDLNNAVVALDEGEWAGPITRGNGRKSFVYLERVNRISASLDEENVQINIERFLKQQRSNQALERFVTGLRERANLGPERFSELAEELLHVAETRVFGPEIPPAS